MSADQWVPAVDAWLETDEDPIVKVAEGKIFRVDMEANAVYVAMSEAADQVPVARTDSVHPNVNLDFDVEGNLLGVEVL